MTVLETQALAARHASRVLAAAGTAEKNAALEAMAQALLERREELLSANRADLEEARKGGMGRALLDRLTLTEERLRGIVEGVRQVAALPDPIGQVEEMRRRPNGLLIGRRRVPMGVIGIIYEARPNVTVDAAVLCLKAGSAVVLRGGKEAFRSNRALTAVMRDALEGAGLPRDCVCLVEDTSRASAQELMGLTEYLDLLIPRGGAGLIRSVAENARVPVIRTGEGVCHVYVLVHRGVAEEFLPMAREFLDKKGVQLRGDRIVQDILGDCVTPAAPEDWDAEYGDYILAVRVVSGLEEAIDFINEHGTGHSECIVTRNYFHAQTFLDQVDAAAVYVNASTRFTDGFEFGLGAEIGISTQKMHARGPMGLEEITSYKYVIYGDGQTR